jgi:1-acyl-sn-glycerol-3-phosphate acyltransferase
MDRSTDVQVLPASPRSRMRRWLRIFVTAFYFLLFFGGSPILSLVLFPWIRLTSRSVQERKARATLAMHKALGLFQRLMSFADLVHAPREVTLPPTVDPGKPYVLITNHPTLVDAVFLLGWFEGLTCVAKGAWLGSVALGSLLRQSNYLPSPRARDGVEPGDEFVERMAKHLRAGHPLLVFPEGSRSLEDRLRRFRRGAVEAAIRAKVPVVALYLDVDRPFLMKGVPFWHVPEQAANIRVERVEVIETRHLESEDAKRVNRELEARYRDRFAQTLSTRAPRLARERLTSSPL